MQHQLYEEGLTVLQHRRHFARLRLKQDRTFAQISSSRDYSNTWSTNSNASIFSLTRVVPIVDTVCKCPKLWVLSSSSVLFSQVVLRTCFSGDDRLMVDKVWAFLGAYICLDFTLALFLSAHTSVPHYHNIISHLELSSDSSFTSAFCTPFIRWSRSLIQRASAARCPPQTPESEKLSSEGKHITNTHSLTLSLSLHLTLFPTVARNARIIFGTMRLMFVWAG